LERAASAASRRPDRVAATAARTAWTAQRRVYRQLRHRKCAAFWSTEFESAAGNPRRIWSTVDRLLGRGRRSCDAIDADALLSYFSSKVDRICSSTSDSTAPTSTTAPPDARFPSFEAVSTADVSAAIAALPNKSSAADPLPAHVLKSVADLLAPFLAHLFSCSLATGRFPAHFKAASITPILKKSSLPVDNPSSYRPISNLSIISKLLERLVARQLTSFLEQHRLLPPYQSGFRRGFSTETAITKVLSDLLDAVDRGDTALLVLLDLSAAFDTVDHDVLLERLGRSFGVSGDALEWFRSYISGRSQYVRCGGNTSDVADVICGVPQGSVLGPILFIMYTADLASIVAASGLSIHQYADDSQIYGSCHSGSTSILSESVVRCTSTVACWMRCNRLQLNADKTDIMWCATTRRASCLPSDPINIAGAEVRPVSTVRSLGVFIDSDLGAASHVRSVVSRCFASLRQLRLLRRYVSDDCFRSLVVALIHSRLDYGNFVMVGLPAFRLRLLQSVLNAAARLTFRLRRYEHISDALAVLHWLRASERIDYKVAVMAYQSLHGSSPSYLHVLQRTAELSNRRQLRSSSSGRVEIPVFRLATAGRRSFPVAAAHVWNSLPVDLRLAQSLSVFRSRLKTFLFRRSFPDVIL
jgi:hypothetical protein